MLPAATVCHAVPGRLRIRVPGMRGNETWFQEIAVAIGRRPELSQVSGNERTATILLHGRNLEPQRFAALARQSGWFELEVGGDGARPPYRAFAGLMFVLAAVQLYRGQVMVPALSFLWQAFDLLRMGERDGR